MPKHALKWKLVIVKRVKKFASLLRKHNQAVHVLLGTSVVLVGCWAIFAPQTGNYNFGSQQSCHVSPRFLPNLSTIESREPFTITRPSSLSIGKFTLYSHRFCVTAQLAPQPQTTYSYAERLFDWPILGHSVQITTQAYPSASQIAPGTLVPPDGVLTFTLNQSDTTFTYAIKAKEQLAACAAKLQTYTCELKQLELDYAQKYDLAIVRQFKGKALGTMSTTHIKTLTPTKVVSTSIAASATIQDKPSVITIDVDKTIVDLGAVTLIAKSNNTETPVPVTASFADKKLTIAIGKELARKTSLELRVASMKADDGSGFAGTTFTLPFSTSGGPQVTGTNIGNRNVGTEQSVSITFDQDIKTDQDLGAAITLMVSGKAQPAQLSVHGNRVVLSPSSPLPLCATFSIKITNAVQNLHGVSGDSVWSINSRAICYATFSIGTSVRGRSITAYRFGSGSNPIVYLGAMHGDEANSKAIMTEWFNELNSNPDRITNRSLVVIPSVNPDGIVSGSRLNANNVDLNRNFPAADWKSVVTSPDSSTPSPAGGPHSLSEPESQAVASYIRQTNPRLVLSFHSSAAIVEANEAGDSVAIASTYASKARYRAVPRSQSGPIFQYDTTGALEGWMHDSLGSPAIVIELLSDTSSEFSRNRDALWYTTGL